MNKKKQKNFYAGHVALETSCHLGQLCDLIRADLRRWHFLGLVQALNLPDCWIAAGFIRNAVWDHQHRRSDAAPDSDVDVIWYDSNLTDPSEDKKHEAALRVAEPSVDWSVKNQARMHVRNGDPPYNSAVEAMRYWPETATAVAARRIDGEALEIAAPFGLEDLMGLILRPTPHFAGDKHVIYDKRLRTKLWTTRWPLLKKFEA